MRLVVDANILIAELLRKRGLDLIASSRLELYMAEKMRNEVEYEFNKRLAKIVAQGRITQDLAARQWQTAFRLLDTKVSLVPISFYRFLEQPAKKRIPRDPNDWESVALALALPAAIWTKDYDFFGCGCAIWTTETLLLQLTE